MYNQLIAELISKDTILRNSLTDRHFKEYYELSTYITSKFELKYIEDVYINNVKIESISGTRRKILKEQQILFNEIIFFLVKYKELKSKSNLDQATFVSLLSDKEIVKHLKVDFFPD